MFLVHNLTLTGQGPGGKTLLSAKQFANARLAGWSTLPDYMNDAFAVPAFPYNISFVSCAMPLASTNGSDEKSVQW